MARLAPTGAVTWQTQFGGPGEDKAYGVASSGTNLYVTGSATAVLPGTTALGGLDGWLAGYDLNGTRKWATSVGGAGDDRLNAVAVTTAGLAVATGGVGGDLVAGAYTGTGKQRWQATVATPAADEGAAVVPLPGGAVSLAGYTRGRVGVVAGAADVLTVRLDGKGEQQAAAQLGTARDDGVDPFAEVNLYATATESGRLAVSGLTYGTPTGGTALGNGDVFTTTVDPATGLPTATKD